MQTQIYKKIVFIIFLLQSGSTHPGGIKSEVPAFVKLGEDQSVFEGEEAVITCIVENIRGAVQWTKGGFGLPPLPASEYENYDMRGQRNKTHGDYSLLIRNASVDDEDFFECQVRPAPDGLGLGSLRSPKMYLTVKKAAHQDQDHVVKIPTEVVREESPKPKPKPASKAGGDVFWIVTGCVGFLAGAAVVSLIICICLKLHLIICRCRESPENPGSPQTTPEMPKVAPISQINDSPGAKEDTTVAVPIVADFLDHRCELPNDVRLCDIYSSPFSAMGSENNEFYHYDTINPIHIPNFTDFEESNVEGASTYDYEKLYSLTQFCSKKSTLV